MYAIPPAATHAGHRADSWNVDKWLKSVSVKVTMKGSKGHIKLNDVETGELFAECPLPKNVPVSAVVEPVIDSSRYFVLRVEDEATRRHAFLGIGFRQRDDASDFKLAVQEHQGRSDREKEGEEKRKEYEEKIDAKRKENEASGIDTDHTVTKLHDFSLKGTISVAVPGSGGGKKEQKTQGGESPKRVGASIAPPPPIALAPPPMKLNAHTPPVVPTTESGWASFDTPSDEGWADFQS